MKCSAKWGKGIAFRTRYEESETQSGIESKTESEIQYEILWPPEAETLHDNNDHC